MFTPWIFSTFNFENFTKYLQGPLKAIFNQGLNCSCSWIFNKDLHHLSDRHPKWMQLDYIDFWRSTSLFSSLLYLFPYSFWGFVFENNFASRCLFLRYRHCFFSEKRSLRPVGLLPPRGIAPSGFRPQIIYTILNWIVKKDCLSI